MKSTKTRIDQPKTNKIVRKPKLITFRLHPKTPKQLPPPPPLGRRRSRRQQPSLSSNNFDGKILPDLPFDIQIYIISKLPIKLILRCKSLSKDFNHYISDLPFNHIYQNNYSSSSNPVLLNCSTLSTIDEDGDLTNISLDLIQFHKDAYNNNEYPIMSKDTIFNSDKVTGKQEVACSISEEWDSGSSIWGYCKGLFCLLNVELNILNLFVVNPILGESIKLPDPVVMCNHWSKSMMSYGLGYCELTNVFKVLRMVTSYLGGTDYQNKTEILTIGVDKKWRSVSDLNVPYNIKRGNYSANPQADMVAFRSSLYWIAAPIDIYHTMENIEPRQGSQVAAFNMTEERVCALPFPPRNLHPSSYGIGVLMDKLCLWELMIFTDDINIWVMDDYGVDGSWKRQFTLKFSRFPANFIQTLLKPLTISVHDGVILISDHRKLVFYHLETNNSSMLIHLINSRDEDDISYPMPFVPDFVSFRNRPGWITDV